MSLRTLALALALPLAAQPAPSFDVQPLAEGVYALVRRDPPGLMVDANCLVVVDEDGVLVVDAPEATKEVIGIVRKLTDRPVRWVVNTHWHDDHIMGNAAFREAFPGVQLIAHARTRAYLPGKGLENRKGMLQGAPRVLADMKAGLTQGKDLFGAPLVPEVRESHASDVRLVEHYLATVPGTEIVLPTVTVEEGLTLHLRRRSVEIRHLGAGHTAGDLVVRLPEDGIVAVGDLVGWPVPLVGGEQSDVAAWAAALGRLQALAPRAILPGHGPVLRDLAQVKLMEELFTSITAQVRAAPGGDLAQVRKAVDLTAFRKRFAGDSKVRAYLFDVYIAGPAVESAWRGASHR